MVRFTLLLPFLVNAAGALSRATSISDRDPQIIPGSFIIEFDDTLDAIDNVLNHFTSAGVEWSRRFEFELFNGATIQFTDSKTARRDAAKLRTLPGIKNIWPNRIHYLPQEDATWTGKTSQVRRRGSTQPQAGNWSTEDTYTPHIMTQVDKLRAKGIVGKGVKLAIVDSGVDYNHPALGGCFGDGCLISFGTDLVGDDYVGGGTPVPDEDPFDCNGHGTHVAGIIAAQNNEYGFTGAAPGVTLGVYRTVGCKGSSGTDVLMDAFLQAYEEGAQIVTSSIGTPNGWSEDPWSVVASRIAQKGVPCTISAGNDGGFGMFYTSTAAQGKWVTGVGSFDNEDDTLMLTGSYFAIDQGDNDTFGYQVGSPANWPNSTMPLWTPSFNMSDAASEGCDEYPADTPDLSPYIILLKSGDSCATVSQAIYASNAGAKSIMLYNGDPTGVETATAYGVDGFLAIGMTTNQQGKQWVSALSKGSNITLDMVDPDKAPVEVQTEKNAATGGFPSWYTAWGPTFEMDVKPQLSTPGGNILSTWPTDKGSYAVKSGTSMSTPLAAAIFALMHEVRGTLDPSVIEPLLAAYSTTQLLNDGTSTISPPILAPVAQQGAGMVRAYDAAYSPLLLSTSTLAFNDTDNFVKTQNFTLTNTGTIDISLKLGHVGAATAYTFPDTGGKIEASVVSQFPGMLFTDEFAEISFNADSITIPAGGGKKTVSVTVTPPQGLDETRIPVYSGYVTLNGTTTTDGEDKPINLSIPYSGAVGSLKKVEILSGMNVAKSTDPYFLPVQANTTFEIPGPESDNSTTAVYPVMVAHLTFGTAQFRAEVVSLGAGETAGEELVVGDMVETPLEYITRRDLYLSWAGELADGTDAPAGRYKLRVAVLRIFGDPTDEESWSVIDSVPFEIKYT